MLRFLAFVAFLLPLSVARPLQAAEIATKEKAAGIIERDREAWGDSLVGVGVCRS
jgi:hypothetical protein